MWDDRKRRRSLEDRRERQRFVDSQAFPKIARYREQGMSWSAIARRLNFYDKTTTSNRRPWSHVTVKRCFDRCQPDLFKETR